MSAAAPASRTTSAMEASSVTSTSAAMISPAPSTRPVSEARSSTSRSQAKTRAPSLASERAIAWPMPRAAPATMAVRPSKRMSMDVPLARSRAARPQGRTARLSAQLCGVRLFQLPDHQERDHGRGQEIEIGRRYRRTGGLDQPGRDEGREPAEDGNREAVAGRHPGRAQMRRKDLRDRRRARARIERKQHAEQDLDRQHEGKPGPVGHEREQRKREQADRERARRQQRPAADLVRQRAPERNGDDHGDQADRVRPQRLRGCEAGKTLGEAWHPGKQRVIGDGPEDGEAERESPERKAGGNRLIGGGLTACFIGRRLVDVLAQIGADEEQEYAEQERYAPAPVEHGLR